VIQASTRPRDAGGSGLGFDGRPVEGLAVNVQTTGIRWAFGRLWGGFRAVNLTRIDFPGQDREVFPKRHAARKKRIRQGSSRGSIFTQVQVSIAAVSLTAGCLFYTHYLTSRYSARSRPRNAVQGRFFPLLAPGWRSRLWLGFRVGGRGAIIQRFPLAQRACAGKIFPIRKLLSLVGLPLGVV